MIDELIRNTCEHDGIPYKKKYYRRAKKAYGKIPHFDKQFCGLKKTYV